MDQHYNAAQFYCIELHIYMIMSFVIHYGIRLSLVREDRAGYTGDYCSKSLVAPSSSG